MPTPAVPLPEAIASEWSICDVRTATGLFAYRQSQALCLLNLPDSGGGDLDAEQRRQVLRQAVTLHKPLSALSLFLGVVGFEDFVRDLAGRVADTTSIATYFPDLGALRTQVRARQADQFFRRLDKDAFASFDPEDINSSFTRAMGIAPVPAGEYWHLRDLALIRHTVAHHAAIIRPIDVPRFAHFIVHAGRLINPPPEFVRSELEYIFRVGRACELAIRDKVFGCLIADFGAGWSRNPPSQVLDLIELFAFFGYIETTAVPVGYAEPGTSLWDQQQIEAQRIKALLVARCVCDLVRRHGA